MLSFEDVYKLFCALLCLLDTSTPILNQFFQLKSAHASSLTSFVDYLLSVSAVDTDLPALSL